MKENNLLKSKKVANNGITLIALVITIIVLLILAGVSIAILIGENGILTQASKAKEQNEIAEVKEQAKLDIMAWRANEIANGRTGVLDDAIIKTIIDGKDYVAEDGLAEESFVTKEGHIILYKDLYTSTTPPSGGDGVKVGEILTGTENKTYTKNGTAKIPVGFMIVPGCDDVSEGLVISDDPDDTEADPNNIVAEGNQFVWIPVINEGQYVRNTTYEDVEVSTTAFTDKEYLPEGIQPDIPSSITNVQEIGALNEAAEREAVLLAGGFYIGRYEAGDSSAIANRTISSGDGTLVSKKNVYAYIGIAQGDAKVKAKTFPPLKNNEYVKSALISGIQWDVVMATINGKKDGNGNNYDVTTAANDSTTSDRHVSGATTGQNIADKVYNIYDLEGNFYEYVAEKNTHNTYFPCVDRGGYYNRNVSASNRNKMTGNADSRMAFRLSLYVM